MIGLEALASALIMAALILVFHVILVHLQGTKSWPVPPMILAFLCYGGSWALYYFINISTALSIELAGGCAIIVASCLIYMEIFSMICRGFSLRIVIDILKKGQLDLDEVLTGYADGKGVDWIIEKRLQGLHDIGFIEMDQEKITLKSKTALFLGHIFVQYKKLFKIGLGG